MKLENNTQVIGGINVSMDAMEKWKKDYDALIASGMAWEFHPWLTGNWEDDKERYIKEIVNWYADTED